MSWNDNNSTLSGILERGFEVEVNGQRVPGVYWTAETGSNERLVLLGHGGTTHKKVDYIVEMARLLVSRGIACMAIDGPGHGERKKSSSSGSDDFSRIWEQGGGTAGMLADWRAAFDFIESVEGGRPTGWWGLSMGTMMGLPVCATDSRISVALLGLMGNLGPNGSDLMRLAPDISCPVRFLVQWHDEIVPRDTCLELFDALGSSKKTMHANPGRHIDVPRMETLGSVDYLDRYLK